MWVPKSIAEVSAALPGLTETASLEMKQLLPVPHRNIDLAKDVAALTIDGGVIIYGLQEDRALQQFSLSPIDLSGVRERVASIVGTRISGAPTIETFSLDDGTATGTGLLVVHVPQSPMAPHMVDGEGYFGRFDTITRLLTAGEVERLFERRANWQNDRKHLLDEAIAASHLTSQIDNLPGAIYIVSHPILGQSDNRTRGGLAVDHASCLDLLSAVLNDLRFTDTYGSGLRDIVPYEFKITLDGIELVRPDGITNSHGHLQILDDGTVRFSFGPMLDVFRDLDHPMIRDAAAAQMVAQVLLLSGKILEAASYTSLVDVTVLLTGCGGAFSTSWYNNIIRSGSALGRIPDSDQPLTARVLASQLLVGEVCETTQLVVGRLLQMLRPAGAPNPLLRTAW